MNVLAKEKYQRACVFVKEENRSVEVQFSPWLWDQAAANESQMFILLLDPDK